MVLFMLSALAELTLFILKLTNVLPLSEIALWAWLVINVLLFVATMICGVLAIQSVYLGKVVEESAARPSVIIKEVIKK